MFTLVCCNFSKSQGGKIQTLLELSYHNHLKKEGMTAAIADHRRRGGRSKPYSVCVLQDICAIRLDFCDFDIPQATAGVVSTSTGRLAVTGPTGKNPPLIAEDNTGMHSE